MVYARVHAIAGKDQKAAATRHEITQQMALLGNLQATTVGQNHDIRVAERLTAQLVLAKLKPSWLSSWQGRKCLREG